MKKTLKFTIILVIIMSLFGIANNVEASSVAFSSSKSEVNVGDTITVTATVTAAQWDLKITLNGKTLATSSELDNYESNITKTITATYKTAKEGNLTFLLEGDATDVSQKVEKVNKNVTVNVKKVETTPDPSTNPQPKPEPKPGTPKELEFKSVNETVYAIGTVNVRKSYSTNSNTLGQLKEGDSVTRTGISKASAEGYNWSKITYNGKIAYVISSKLTTTKPVEEPKQEEPKEEQPKEEEPKVTTEEPTDDEKTVVKDGLKSLEIEGLTLSPTFSPDVYEYRVIVKKDISELTINAVPASEGAKVTIAGNNNLQEGENLVTIVVYNSKGEVEATYQITTNKNTVDLGKTDQILQLGTKKATRNLIIFIALLCVAVVALVVIIILKHKNKNHEDYNEKIDSQDYYESEESTNSEETVENTQEQTTKEDSQKTKKKGKHF